MTNIHIPIRRIRPEEIVEFLEWLMNYSDLDFTEEGIGRDHKLTLLTLDASMGKLTIEVSAEERGLAALTQLKWGMGVDEHSESVKPEMNKGGTDDFEDG